MNRSILIVICDFLLVSLLAFSSVDFNNVARNGTANSVQMTPQTNQAEVVNKDLAAAMKLALDEEKKNEDKLKADLASARNIAGDRDARVQAIQQQLTASEQEARRLQQLRFGLEQQLSSAQSSVQVMNLQLSSNAAEALLTKEKIAAMEAEARKQNENSAALQQQLAALSKSNQAIQTEKLLLASRLDVAEVERRHATEQATRMENEVKIEREEKAKLADGMKTIASKSADLEKEVRENRPIAANTIYSDFLANRVRATFNASRSGVFGMDASKRKETGTVLVTDGTNTFALCHVQDTPLALWIPGTDWEGLTGTLGRPTSANFVQIHSLSFCSPDPRVVLMPVSKAEADQLASKVYKISADPYKFQDAVVIGSSESYYGECRFQIDAATPDYVRLDRNLLKGLFGKFNPAKGDLVLSHTGELLGVMANDSFCIMIRNLDSMATLQFGQDVRAQKTGATLSRLYSAVQELPVKLQ